MKQVKKINFLDLYLNKKKNINKEDNYLILKKSSLATKPKSIMKSPVNRNVTFNTPNKDYNYNAQNININSNSNSNEQQNILKILKYKKLLLPSLSTNRVIYKGETNSKPNKNIKNKTKLIKIKKLNYFSLSDYKNKNINKKLKGLYKENFVKKRHLEKYKEYKNKNFDNFSFQKYNEKLISLSGIDLSEDNLQIFKKNMKCIEKAMNGRSSIKNKFHKFFDGIEEIKINDKKPKILSLSENTTPRNNNINIV